MPELTTDGLPSQPGWDCHLHVFDANTPVLAGYYQPPSRSLEEIERIASQHNIGHLVLVQPSVYGRDNSLMLSALERSQGRHRGVVVIDSDIDSASLERMHELGVRGIRFNRMSPVGQHADPEQELQALAPRLRELGWHVQWFIPLNQVAQLLPMLERYRLPFVLDHMASVHASVDDADPAWLHMKELGASGMCWVKASAWYRLQAATPYFSMDRHVQKMAQIFGERMVWGSDWPHTGIAATDMPDYDQLLHVVRRSLGESQAAEVINQCPLALYR